MFDDSKSKSPTALETVTCEYSASWIYGFVIHHLLTNKSTQKKTQFLMKCNKFAFSPYFFISEFYWNYSNLFGAHFSAHFQFLRFFLFFCTVEVARLEIRDYVENLLWKQLKFIWSKRFFIYSVCKNFHLLLFWN